MQRKQKPNNTHQLWRLLPFQATTGPRRSHWLVYERERDVHTTTPKQQQCSNKNPTTLWRRLLPFQATTGPQLHTTSCPQQQCSNNTPNTSTTTAASNTASTPKTQTNCNPANLGAQAADTLRTSATPTSQNAQEQNSGTGSTKQQKQKQQKKKDGTSTNTVYAQSAKSAWTTSRNSQSTTLKAHAALSCAVTATTKHSK